jgi:hypothetical protein
MSTSQAFRLGVVSAVALASVGAAQTLQIVDNLPGTFTDISGTGINLGIHGDDSATIFPTIGNAVFPAGRVVVGNNGGMGFNPPDDYLAPVNQPIPSMDAFGGGQAALAFWDDIGNDTGTVLWEQVGGELIVQWHNVHFGPREDFARFQIKIFGTVDPNNPVYAQFIYADIEQPRPGGGVSATIGYQDGGAHFNDVQWSFNTANAVHNGTVLSIVPEPGMTFLLLLGVCPLLRRR